MTRSGAPSGGAANACAPHSAAQSSVEVQPGYHAVKFYSSALDLANAAGPFLAGALRPGEPAALIARDRIAKAILHSLRRSGIDVDAARRQGTLLVVDFDGALAATCHDGRVDAARFESFAERLAGQLRSTVQPSRARIYCELGTELCRVGRQDEAIELERLGEQFLERSGCGLMCGYSVRDFSRASHPKAYVEICGMHQRVLHERDVLGILQETKRELESLRRDADQLAIALRERANVEAAGDEVSADHLEALHQLAADVSGIFDDSLTLVLGWGELLGHIDLPAEDQREVGGQIAQTARAAAAMSRQLLAFGDRDGLGAEVVRTEDGVRDAWRLIELASGHRVSCTIAIDAAAGRLAAPRNDLAEVTVLLGLSALERAGKSGSIQLRVEELDVERASGDWSSLEPGRYVLLEVWDDGRHESDAEFQLHALEEIVAQRGGGMLVRTGPHLGTNVRAALPAASQAEPAEDAAAHRQASAPAGTILVVERRPALRRLIVMQLEVMDHRVIGCAGLEEAAASVGLVDQVDCLVTDPLTAGGLATSLCERFPDIAFLLIAARGEGGSMPTEASAAGRTDVLEKPFSASDLSRRVNALLRPD